MLNNLKHYSLHALSSSCSFHDDHASTWTYMLEFNLYMHNLNITWHACHFIYVHNLNIHNMACLSFMCITWKHNMDNLTFMAWTWNILEHAYRNRWLIMGLVTWNMQLYDHDLTWLTFATLLAICPCLLDWPLPLQPNLHGVLQARHYNLACRWLVHALPLQPCLHGVLSTLSLQPCLQLTCTWVSHATLLA